MIYHLRCCASLPWIPSAHMSEASQEEQKHRLSDEGMRRFPSHERLDSMFATVGGIMKSAGGKPKSSLREDLRAAENKPLSSRMLVTSMLVLVFCLLMNQVGLFVPLVIMARNCALSKVPPSVLPKYATCSDQMLANEMTIIVTVKDTCSQAPPPIATACDRAPLWSGPWIAGLCSSGRTQLELLLSTRRSLSAWTVAGLSDGPRAVRAAVGAPHLHLPQLQVVRHHRPVAAAQVLEEGDQDPAASARQPDAGLARRHTIRQDQVQHAAAQRRVRRPSRSPRRLAAPGRPAVRLPRRSPHPRTRRQARGVTPSSATTEPQPHPRPASPSTSSRLVALRS